MSSKREGAKNELLETNIKQKSFYNKSPEKRKLNIIMRAWRNARRNMYFLLHQSGIWEDIYAQQKEWLGDLSEKKVLDFGCYEGNMLSTYLAANCKEYVGLDLSEKALTNLDITFQKKGLTNYKLISADILSDSFQENEFDVIYAQGVLHHFNPISVILPVLQEKLSDSGMIVSIDPLRTSLLTNMVRSVYHPFRIDKEWEWPFTKKTIDEIGDFFTISQMQGFMGAAKWSIPLAIVNKNIAIKATKALHGNDRQKANKIGRSLYGCLQLSMCLKK